MKQKDARMALVSEAIGAIRTVKLHAWEAEFESRIAALRRREVATLLRFQVLNAVTSTLWLTAPTMAGLASFLVKSQMLGQTITPAEGFTSLTLFQLHSISLTFLPSVNNQAIQANDGVRRISRYLALPDVDGRGGGDDAAAAFGCAATAWRMLGTGRSVGNRYRRRTRRLAAAVGRRRPMRRRGHAGCAAVETRARRRPRRAGRQQRMAAPPTAPMPPTAATVARRCAPTLTGINLDVGLADRHLWANRLRQVVAALLGRRLDGEVLVRTGRDGGGDGGGRRRRRWRRRRRRQRWQWRRRRWLWWRRRCISYVPPGAFVASATLRDDILFGLPFDQARYDAVLEACAARRHRAARRARRPRDWRARRQPGGGSRR